LLWQWFLVVLAISFSLFRHALDNTVVANIVPAITNDLGHATELAWLSVGHVAAVPASFALVIRMLRSIIIFTSLLSTASACCSPWARYALPNPNWIYILSVVLFSAGSALCGAAPGMPAMIVGCVVAGVGGIGLYLGTVSLLSLNIGDQKRPACLNRTCVISPASTFLRGGDC
jgi:hypothetical protein